MISLDQILLLEKKVESAVAKIAQLQAENDALRSKCAELTNALSSKSEQLTTFEQDQNRIENGILKALDRLSAIENTVLKAASQSETGSKTENTVSEPVKSENIIQNNTKPFEINEENLNKSSSPLAEEKVETDTTSDSSYQNEMIYSNFQNQSENNVNTKQFYDMNQVNESTDFQNDSNPDIIEEDIIEDENNTDENTQFDIF